MSQSSSKADTECCVYCHDFAMPEPWDFETWPLQSVDARTGMVYVAFMPNPENSPRPMRLCHKHFDVLNDAKLKWLFSNLQETS